MSTGKFQKWLEPENLILLEGWARDGLTDDQIAHNMGIATGTLYRWKNEYNEICDALKKGKEVVDLQVENALLKKALGHKEKILKPFKLKEIKYHNGRKQSEIERIEYAEEEVYIPPDTTADIYWLNNRRSDKWRNKQKEETDAATLEKLDELIAETKEQAARSVENAVHNKAK